MKEKSAHQAVNPGQRTYREVTANGHYGKYTGGLFGKHDNVRLYWENQITRYTLQRFLHELVERKQSNLERIRILDMGCGSGEGYELLTNVRRRGIELSADEVRAIPSEMIALYKGIDINPAMVEQGRTIYVSNGKVVFEEGDLREGLSSVQSDPAYDIYFSSYGSLSHLEDAHLLNLLIDIAEHCDEWGLVVLDLLGKFSYEWQERWEEMKTDSSEMYEYSMSYLSPEETREEQEVESFPMRYWTTEELENLIEEVNKKTKAKLETVACVDRSIFVGRHMDTQEYNKHAQPIRQAVNSLHEMDVRTDLSALLIDYLPREGFEDLNPFFESLQMAWNTLVNLCMKWLVSPDGKLDTELMKSYPDSLQTSIKTIKRLIENVGWMRMGDPRANIIEPQLGYALRNLEMDLQDGLGVGHGLICILQVTA